ncbi:hypothetical protein, partial [Pyramidobacter sp. C12-8]|uniref:hypothetical protein n=2 Tax=unclassified Pyramidobacter TaxID=2632171 RepID=UPI00197CEA4D
LAGFSWAGCLFLVWGYGNLGFKDFSDEHRMQLHVAGGKMFFFIGQPNEKAISFSSPFLQFVALSKEAARSASPSFSWMRRWA